MAKNVAAVKAPELSEDQKNALLFHHVKAYDSALGVKKGADAKFKHVCKLARSEIGGDAIDRIKTVIQLRTPEGEAEVRADVGMKLEVARAVAAPLGNQFELFTDRQPADDRAYAEGKRDGLAGAPNAPSWGKGSPQHARYAEGWKAGQAILAKGFRPPTPLEAAAKPGPAQAVRDAARKSDKALKDAIKGFGAGKGVVNGVGSNGATSAAGKATSAAGKAGKGRRKSGAKLTLIKDGGAEARVRDLAKKAGAKPAAH